MDVLGVDYLEKEETMNETIRNHIIRA
jgi:hypothetical protein